MFVAAWWVFGDARDADVAGDFGRWQFQCGLVPAARWCGAAPCRRPGRRPDGLGLVAPRPATDRPVPHGRQSRPRPLHVQWRVVLPGLRVVCGS